MKYPWVEWALCLLIPIAAIVGVAAWLAPAEASPAIRQLTVYERSWVVECAKYPTPNQSPQGAVHDCTERARILGERGWL